MTNNQLEIRNFIGAFLDVVIVYKDRVEVKFKFKVSNDFNYLDSCTCTRENLIARGSIPLISTIEKLNRTLMCSVFKYVIIPRM